MLNEHTEQDQNKYTPLLRCVKYVLDFYFGETSLETIDAFRINGDDHFDVDQASEILKNFNLITMKRKISFHIIPKYFLPSIVLDHTGQCLVYLKSAKNITTVFDPKQNKELEIDSNKLKDYKQALFIFKDTQHMQYFQRSHEKAWFYEPLKAYWRSYIEIGILTIFINIFALAIPLFVMNIYNRVVPNQAYETLFVLSIGATLILAFDVFFKYTRNHILEKIGKKLGLYWEEELMRKIMLIDLKFDHYTIGSKVNLFKELQQIRDFFALKSIVQIVDFPFFIIAVVAIYLISPLIASIPFFCSIVIILINIVIQMPMSKLSQTNSHNLQSKYSFILESIQGVESLKLNNDFAKRLFLWKKIVSFSDGIGMKIQSLQVLSLNISQFIIQIVTIFVVGVGVFEIANQNLTVGGLIAITMLSSRAMVPVINLSGMVIRLKEISESLRRINEVMSLPTEDERHIESAIGKLDGKIEFKNVCFSFKASNISVLDNLSFLIKPGERVGIIGQVGAGKSTLVKLLAGLYLPTKGSVYLDSNDISMIRSVEIRQNIGVMTQEPFLFNATLKENIEFFHPINKKRLIEIIKITGLEEFVRKSGKGDGFIIGERGDNLSVGQKHLVALARVIAKNPSIIILDEPTTGLDVGFEKKLIEHLNVSITKDKTLLVVTHRLAALELVDRILVMNDGKIVADGPKEIILNALRNPIKVTQ